MSLSYSTSREAEKQGTRQNQADNKITFYWRRDVALYYAEHFHWLCLPAIMPDKRPVCRWRDIRKLPPLDKLEDMWIGYRNHHIAVLTGKRSGIVVGDVDIRHGGKIETLWELGWPQDTVIAQTGSGGFHVYVQCPPEGLRNNSQYAEGIEFKADGTLVIAPPSHNPETERWYRWLPHHEPFNTAVLPLPDAVLADIVSRTAVVEAHEPVEPSQEQLERLAKRAPGLVTQAIRRVLASNGRNNTGYWLACRLRDLHVSDDVALSCMRAYQREVEHWNG